MIVLSNLLLALAPVVHGLFQLAWWLLVARIVISWVRPRPTNDFVRGLLSAVVAVTEPVLYKARQLMPFLVVGGLDLTPIVVFLGLGFLDNFVTSTLVDVAMRLA